MPRSRRGFLTSLFAVPFLQPLMRMIPAPVRAKASGISLDEINSVTMKAIMPGIADQFFKSSPLLDYLEEDD